MYYERQPEQNNYQRMYLSPLIYFGLLLLLVAMAKDMILLLRSETFVQFGNDADFSMLYTCMHARRSRTGAYSTILYHMSPM